jgi:hypothetical protein
MGFNLAEYQTVQERIDLFWQKYPNGRLNLDIVSITESQVVMRGEVYLDKEDKVPTTVDFAEERIGTSNVNKVSFVENCATSCYGRAISALGGEFSPKGKRPSAEEMAKVNRHNNRDWLAEADTLALTYDVDKLRLLYTDAVAAKVSADILEKIKAYGSTAKP